MGLKSDNKRYLPWIIGIALLHFTITQSVKLCSFNTLQINKQELIFYFSLLIIPWGAVNTIFLFKKLFKQTRSGNRFFWPPRILGLFVGVTLFTLLFEYIYQVFEIVDDDYYVIGNYEASLTVSELIDNNLIGLFIGIPVLFKERLEEKTNQAIKTKENELEKAYKLKIQSELDLLQSKVNPHFLYNSLNSIVSLIHEDAAKAEKMILLLSDLLRYSLNYNEGSYSTIAEELDMVNAYLAIEMIRFEDHLKCDIEVEDALRAVLIPRFLLQPLIENAIKHGTSLIQNGYIQLKIKRDGNDVLISVIDNGPHFPEDPSSGYGLKATFDKLKLLYGDNFSMDLINSPVKSVEIALRNGLRHA